MKNIALILTVFLTVFTTDCCASGFGNLLNQVKKIADDSLAKQNNVNKNSSQNTSEVQNGQSSKVDPVILLGRHGFNKIDDFVEFKQSIPDYPGQSITPYEDDILVGRIESLYEDTKNLSSSSYLKYSAEQQRAASELFNYNSIASSFLRDRSKAIAYHMEIKKQKDAEALRNEKEKQQEIARYEAIKAKKAEEANARAEEEARQNKIYQEQLKQEEAKRNQKVTALVNEWKAKGYNNVLLASKVSMFDERNGDACYFVEFINELNGKLSIKENNGVLKLTQDYTDDFTGNRYKIIWGFKQVSNDRLVFYRLVQNDKDFSMRGASDSFVTVLQSAGLL